MDLVLAKSLVLSPQSLLDHDSLGPSQKMPSRVVTNVYCIAAMYGREMLDVNVGKHSLKPFSEKL